MRKSNSISARDSFLPKTTQQVAILHVLHAYNSTYVILQFFNLEKGRQSNLRCDMVYVISVQLVSWLLQGQMVGPTHVPISQPGYHPRWAIFSKTSQVISTPTLKEVAKLKTTFSYFCRLAAYLLSKPPLLTVNVQPTLIRSPQSLLPGWSWESAP